MKSYFDLRKEAEAIVEQRTGRKVDSHYVRDAILWAMSVPAGFSILFGIIRPDDYLNASETLLISAVTFAIAFLYLRSVHTRLNKEVDLELNRLERNEGR